VDYIVVLVQQSIEHVSIEYTCNTYFTMHVNYSVVSGQYQYSISLCSLVGNIRYVKHR